MRKRFLGFICLLYFGIIIYVILTDELKNYLAPNMQLYIKLSIAPLLIMGLVLLCSSDNNKFKISDIVLLLPLLLLIISGDGRLTASLAGNRMVNFNMNKNIKREVDNSNTLEEKQVDTISEEIIEIDNKEEEKEEQDNSMYDFTNPYFEIIDSNYNELSNYITFAPKASKYEGETIRIKGFALKESSNIPTGYFAIGKYAITCCAADASFTGFIAKYDISKVENDKWYQIEGILHKDEVNNVMYIDVINILDIDSKNEEQYVYPCYGYNDGTCDDILKYNLEY